MLLSLEVKNFCSFKDGFKFSMKPGKTMSRFEDNVIQVKNKKVSKVSVIVGENAGGKSNFMTSIDYFKYLIKEDMNHGTLKKLCYNNDNTVQQEFKIEAIIEDKIYLYIIKKDKYSNLLEELYITSINKNVDESDKIFSVRREKLDTESKIIEIVLELNEDYISKEIGAILSNGNNNAQGLFLNKLYKIGFSFITPFVEWIKNKLIIKLPDQHSLNFYKQIEKNEEEIAILKTKEFLEIFSIVDPSISNIEVDEKEPFEDTLIIRKKGDSETFSIKLKDDSSGVRDFFAWAIEIWKVIYEDATLFADELDKVFNSILSEKVLNYVKTMSSKGQFIFSTHNILHINTIDFMKEQIHFINKEQENLSSEMYSLSDFKDYRYDKPKVYEMYLKGLLGGVPND
ncbi:AAA family ATPase [Clostridium saudiense]|uniref:AAA family ATPase n=1 Tax=Clostridium saudiense TaxID=1414720 RepID=UPI0018A8A4CC|nr:AAA family ATPase [Clostridium saudiense]